MNELQTEINDLKEFMQDLKADRAAAKEKEKREAWTKYVSLSVVIIAVIAAVAAQWAGKYGGQVSMSQAQASDQWAFYQAKSIKQHMDDAALLQLTTSPAASDPKVAEQIKKLQETVGRYDQEKADIKSKAEGLEQRRNEAGKRGGKMGLAVSIFTVAIASASICMVTKKKPLWFVALLLAAFAMLQMIQAWTS
jgi:uncharacterized membrane protein YoaK (UPF0700 family)